MTVCSKCGSEMGDGARFCPRCGSPRSPVSDAALLSWEIEIPLLGNRFILSNVGTALFALVGLLAVVFGLLARNPGAVGAGLAGTVGEAVLVEWDEVQGVRAHPEQRVVTVRRRLMPDLHVFCTPENFTQVSSHLSRKAPGGARS